jgi:multisubunit Na+/H+ antiporter MnhF subunit
MSEAWLVAAAVLIAGLVPCSVVCARADATDGLVALQTATVVTTLALLVLSIGFGRSIYLDVAVVLAVLSFAGAMVFIRFLERWDRRG